MTDRGAARLGSGLPRQGGTGTGSRAFRGSPHSSPAGTSRLVPPSPSPTEGNVDEQKACPRCFIQLREIVKRAEAEARRSVAEQAGLKATVSGVHSTYNYSKYTQSSKSYSRRLASTQLDATRFTRIAYPANSTSQVSVQAKSQPNLAIQLAHTHNHTLPPPPSHATLLLTLSCPVPGFNIIPQPTPGGYYFHAQLSVHCDRPPLGN